MTSDFSEGGHDDRPPLAAEYAAGHRAVYATVPAVLVN